LLGCWTKELDTSPRGSYSSFGWRVSPVADYLFGPPFGALLSYAMQMDRFAVFVDAGHLLAEGGKLCLGTRKRSLFECDYSAIAVALVDLARRHSGQDLLRVYWYDGAYHGIPKLDHLRIAGLPNVKLRLGRMSGGKQKGVDSLVVRDLMTQVDSEP
jgi:hypothetical protein